MREANLPCIWKPSSYALSREFIG